jgi:phage gp29-like protein
MSILKSEVAYPYYPGKYSLYPEYTNLTSEAELRQVLFDGKVIECLQSLLGELLQYPLSNLEPKSGKDQLETVMQVTDSLDLNHIALSVASAMITGYSVSELVWGKVGDKLLPTKLLPRDLEVLRYQFSDPTRGVVPYLWVRGQEIAIPPRKFIITRYWSIPNSDPYGNGLGEALYPLVKLRGQAILDWGKFSSTYAEPVRVGTYPVNASDEEIQQFNKFIQALGTARAVTLPEGFTVEYIDPPKSTTGLQADLYNTINQDISLLILGEATAGKTDPGNKAKDTVSADLRSTRAKMLGRLLTDTLNTTLVTWIQQLNYPLLPPCKLAFDYGQVERQVPQ